HGHAQPRRRRGVRRRRARAVDPSVHTRRHQLTPDCPTADRFGAMSPPRQQAQFVDATEGGPPGPLVDVWWLTGYGNEWTTFATPVRQSVGSAPEADPMPTTNAPVPGGAAAVTSWPVVPQGLGGGALSGPFPPL